jgi:transcription-repair coupling factor (superfamily II helicase)
MLDKIAQGHPVSGMEALSPALVDGMELLIDLRRPIPTSIATRAGAWPGKAGRTSEFLRRPGTRGAVAQAPIDLGASAISRSPVRRCLSRGMA